MLSPPSGYSNMFPEPEREPEPGPQPPYQDLLSPIDDRANRVRFERAIHSMYADNDAYVGLVHLVMDEVTDVAEYEDGMLVEADYSGLLEDVFSWQSPHAMIECRTRTDALTGIAPESLLLSDMRGQLATDLAFGMGQSLADVRRGFVHIDIPELYVGTSGAIRLHPTTELAGAAQVTATLSNHADLREPLTGPQAVATYQDLSRFIVRHHLLTMVDS